MSKKQNSGASHEMKPVRLSEIRRLETSNVSKQFRYFACAQHTLENLPTTAFFSAGHYGLIAILHFMGAPRDVRQSLVFSTVTNCIAGLAMSKVYSRRTSLDQAPLGIFAPVVVLILLSLKDAFNHIYIRNHILQTTDVMLLLLFQGYFLLDWKWLAFSQTVTWICYVYVTRNTTETDLWIHFVWGLFTTCVLSWIIHFSRIREIVYDALQRQQLEKANSAKDILLQNVSHEIRTPLNGIILGADMAISSLHAACSGDARKVAEQRELLDTIRNSSRNLLVIVNDLLDLSKSESGNFSVTPHSFSPRADLFDSVQNLRLRCSQSGIKLRITSDSLVPVMLDGTDPVRWCQNATNLISNATKFTPKGGKIQVHMTWRQRKEISFLKSHPDWFEWNSQVESDDHLEPNEGYLIVTVEDTGHGISSEELPRIFEPFHQVDSSQTRKHHGTGLGLAIVKRLTEVMGGQVTVASKFGVGSIFGFSVRANSTQSGQVGPLEILVDDPGSKKNRPNHISLPPQEFSFDPTSTVSSRGSSLLSPPILTFSQNTKLKLLLAEDNPINQKLLQRLFTRAGYDVVIVENGVEAVKAVCSPEYFQSYRDKTLYHSTQLPSHFDALILDISMPEMTGLEAASIIRTYPVARISQMPIIALTAHASESDKQECLNAGVDVYLSKPVESSLILGWLEKVVMEWNKQDRLARIDVRDFDLQEKKRQRSLSPGNTRKRKT